ncbi:hypothetical protein JR316_0000079 [Psilocybe cubensis]|uniref:Uncharacterized protein n=2 Tax=Psilocybe cubensis TaxID=181762 RepID=A0ACB8HDQ7_PSICU|nr:hypothetical protein JR316_0000079 [Psilocybe cubensis]KAH9486016.1 hypothetical protein JR316_0000079 [Psilocybe cubensis]
MKFSLATAVSFIVAGAGFVNAAPSEAMANSNDTMAAAPYGINLGETFNNVVAWVDGQSKCNNVVVAAKNTNPCNIPFSLNGNTFKIQGCGGPLWITQGSGNSFWANCGSFSEGDACGVHTTYHCL